MHQLLLRGNQDISLTFLELCETTETDSARLHTHLNDHHEKVSCAICRDFYVEFGVACSYHCALEVRKRM